MKGTIYILSGTKNSGKAKLVNDILKKRKNLVKALSYTTREKREDEGSNTYLFITKKHFLKKIEEGEFLEVSETDNNLYGTGIEAFNPVNEGKDVIKIINKKGALKLKN